jgi:hypothetical protein
MATDTAPSRYRWDPTPGDTPDTRDDDRLARVVAGLELALAGSTPRTPAALAAGASRARPLQRRAGRSRRSARGMQATVEAPRAT